MGNDESAQTTFGDGGEIQTPEPTSTDEDDSSLKDDGTEMKKYDTKGGLDQYIVGSALQKAIRRSDEELAAWSAWELVRSGYGWWFWNRLAIIAVEEAVSEDQTLVLVDTLERLAKKKWSMDEWEGIVCAIRAAIACARMPKSREHVHGNRVFTAMKNERVAAEQEDRKPRYDFPEIPDEAYDQHTLMGRKQGRGFKHFMVHSGRLDNETEMGAEFKEFLMNNVEMAYPDKDISQSDISRSDIKRATTPVEPGEHDKKFHDQ
ncbi:hypothetical protein HUG10_20660 (plasmid) [Halorarum halophilum]|uniref:MgsA AAA+ ATPase C-terminal domain-containing protein n=1 Tax=Halorarum halophilum TaxID=2743090 RepID=A0A7D5K3Y6_9EURY|nr:hypothetical protein [Halobaculum halophilum]QLG30021.1 hypothetical protein HUG10_20660 [Halobaculum halophilum]